MPTLQYVSVTQWVRFADQLQQSHLLVGGHGLVAPELEELRREEELVGLGLLGDAVVLGVRL